METIATTLGVVFLAELGDKTQLVALSFGARYQLRSVMAGVVLAYLATTICSVAVGSALGSAFPTRAINLVGGLLFLGFAFQTILTRNGEPDEEFGEGVDTAGTRTRSVVATVAAAMFVAELGDKTMIATAALAARDQASLVAIGALIGISAAGLIGVLVGRTIGRALPEQTIRLGSSVLFAAFGVALLASAI